MYGRHLVLDCVGLEVGVHYMPQAVMQLYILGRDDVGDTKQGFCMQDTVRTQSICYKAAVLQAPVCNTISERRCYIYHKHWGFFQGY